MTALRFRIDIYDIFKYDAENTNSPLVQVYIVSEESGIYIPITNITTIKEIAKTINEDTICNC